MRGHGAAVVGALGSATDAVGDFAPRALDELGRYRTLVDSVEAGLPTDPAALARFALDLLLPGPRVELDTLARETRALRDAADGVSLRIGASNGLVTALDAVTTAAAGGDAAALSAALATVQRLRASVLSNLAADLQRFATDVTALRADQALAPLADLAHGVRDAHDSVVEQLDTWRQQVADIGGMVEHIDTERLSREVPAFIDQLEAWVTAQLDAAVDAQVERLATWLRELFAHLPLRALRAELSEAIDRLAAAVTAAGLDRVVNEVRAALDAVEAAIGDADLADRVQAAISAVEQTIAGTITTLVDQLGVVTAAVEDVAEDAGEVLERVSALEGFRGAVDAVVALVDGAGIEAAGQEVVTTLADLRAVAEELLSVAPLPDALRPVVDQLVATLDAIDIDALVREPLTAAATQLELPDSLAADVSGGLAVVAEAISAVVPQQLIADLDAVVDAFVEAVRPFDPASLLGDLTGFLEEAARFVEELDPRPLAAELRPGFSAVLGAVDAAHPRRLLAPVIDAYTDLLGTVTLPEPATSVRRLSASIDTVGEVATSAAGRPMTTLAPDATVSAPTETPSAATPPLPGAADLRAGDVVRLFGWVPDKLREALAALDTAGVTAFLAEVDALVGGLTADLRAVAAALQSVEARLDSGLDEVLAPVAAAQVRAQLAVQASATASGGATAGMDVDLSIEILASVGPGPLRSALERDEQLARDRTVAAAGALTGATATALLRAADTLERCALARLVADADAFLAALDPEPIAAEIDALIAAAIDAAPAVIDALGDTIEGFQARIDRLLGLVDPSRLMRASCRCSTCSASSSTWSTRAGSPTSSARSTAPCGR